MSTFQPIYPTQPNGTKIPAVGLQTRTGKIGAPAWRGALSPDTFFIEDGATVIIDNRVTTDEYRAYHVCVKNDSNNAFWAGTVMVDGGTLAASPTAAAPAVVQTDTASRVRIWYDATDTSYKISNNLGAGAAAFVSILRVG